MIVEEYISENDYGKAPFAVPFLYAFRWHRQAKRQYEVKHEETTIQN